MPLSNSTSMQIRMHTNPTTVSSLYIFSLPRSRNSLQIRQYLQIHRVHPLLLRPSCPSNGLLHCDWSTSLCGRGQITPELQRALHAGQTSANERGDPSTEGRGQNVDCFSHHLLSQLLSSSGKCGLLCVCLFVYLFKF